MSLAEWSHRDPALTTTVTTAVVGLALTFIVRGPDTTVLAVAVVQSLLLMAVAGFPVPGQGGVLTVGVAAAAAADVVVFLWPGSRLAPLLAVLGLAAPALFVHQLTRGVRRAEVVASFGAAALLIVGVVSAAALVQVRHSLGVDAAFAAVLVVMAGVVTGCLVDLVAAVPRFDAEVPRGGAGVAAAMVIGAAVGALVLRGVEGFGVGRGLVIGAALGVLAALLSVAASFVADGAPPAGSPREYGRSGLLVVALPPALLAPVALVLCLAIRG